MSTPFSTIYNRALFKFKDHDLLNMSEETRETFFFNFLVMSQTEFQKFSKIDILKRNDELKEYSEDLDDEIINILALGIAYNWISFSTIDDDKLKNRMNTSDYNLYSPANNLKANNELRKDLLKEFRQAIRQYTYKNGDLTQING